MIYDITEVAQDKHIPGMILLIDFKKAFDSLLRKLMYNTLQFFNFTNILFSTVESVGDDLDSGGLKGLNGSKYANVVPNERTLGIGH